MKALRQAEPRLSLPAAVQLQKEPASATDMPGRWSDGDLNEFRTHDSPAEYFHSLADEMRRHGKTEDGCLAW